MFLTSNYTPSEGKGFYYVYVVDNSGKKLLVFECSDVFIVNLLSFCKRHVREENW